MSVERDKTGLRRCKQRGRSQSCCLLRRRRREREKTHKSRRHGERPSGPSGRGYDRASVWFRASEAGTGRGCFDHRW